VRVHVAFTPAEAVAVPTTIVVDVLRATSTIVQALDSGYERVFCCAEVDEARSLRDELGDAVLAGERGALAIEGFDLGNSPREFLEPRASAVVLTTTNGTRAVAAAAAAGSGSVLIGSLLNAGAVAKAARTEGTDTAIVCAGVDGAFALDDAYCAGRIVDALGCARTDAAEAAAILARSFAQPEDALRAAQNPRQEGLGADEIAWCAREGVSSVVPRLVGLRGAAAELRA
jgi:2-phosphosulfolactate phosphatase